MSELKKYLFIVNPVSGKKDSSLVLVPRLMEFIKKRNIDAVVELTRHKGHAYDIAKNYIRKHKDLRIISCGGDGTLNEIANAAKFVENAEICCLPCGTGNDFILNFGSVPDFLSLERNVINGKSKPIDLINTDDSIAIAICSVGVDAEIAYSIPKFRRMRYLGGGSMAYNAAIVNRLLKPISGPLTVIADGEEFQDDFTLVSIANGKFYGGGICAAPRAVLDDGILELCMVKKVTRPKLVQLLGRYKQGKHIIGNSVAPNMRKYIEIRRVKNVVIKANKPFVANLDGECEYKENINATVLEKAVNFVVPSGLI